MGQVTVTLNGRTYSLECADGEEPRLLELAGFVQQRLDALAAEFGQIGDDRLLLMTAIMITDELTAPGFSRTHPMPQGAPHSPLHKVVR